MWNQSFRWVVVACGGWFGYQMSAAFQHDLASVLIPGVPSGVVKGQGFALALFFIVLFFFGYSWSIQATRSLLHRTEERVKHIPIADGVAAVIGLVVGLIVSALLFPIFDVFGGAGGWLSALASVVFGFAGARLAVMKHKDAAQLVLKRSSPSAEQEPTGMKEHKILDTSVIIDGRIADICTTGFIEGTLVIPEFVLEELQHIADSSDLLKRNRGRRGLDILNKIQKELDVKVLIYEGDYEEIAEVDSKLVKLAKALRGKVVTNDFNLNKVCELQGVAVLNINDLANAVKPVVLPGEEILVQVIKDGKEHGQGVAYLDDGTMIVVEGGRDFIGAHVEVLVTSVLQTSAGRMIFAKPKLLEKAL